MRKQLRVKIMLSECSYYEFALGRGKAVSLRRAAGREIVCLDGRIWLTEEPGGADVWLAKGERFMLARPGRIVIEAERGARLRVCLPSSWWRRVLAEAAARARMLRIARLAWGNRIRHVVLPDRP